MRKVAAGKEREGEKGAGNVKLWKHLSAPTKAPIPNFKKKADEVRAKVVLARSTHLINDGGPGLKQSTSVRPNGNMNKYFFCLLHLGAFLSKHFLWNIFRLSFYLLI